MSQQPVSRKEALMQGHTRYNTGGPCKKGHTGERYTANHECCICCSEKQQRAGYKKYQRAYHDAHPEVRRQKVVYSRLRRQHINQRAMPLWADKTKIQEVYNLCQSLIVQTGIPHEVDHIYPLKGKLVSGLHVHNNLRAIPAKVNQKKHNKMESSDECAA